MPVSRSAKKALKVSSRRKKENELYKILLRKTIKATRKHANLENLRLVQKALDKAAQKAVIHENKARRLLIRLTKLAKKPDKK